MHILPTYQEPVFNFRSAHLYLGDNDMTTFPYTLAEDIQQAPMMHLCLHRIAAETSTTDEALIEISLFRNNEERPCFFMQESFFLIDDPVQGSDQLEISLEGALPHLSCGSYTLYVSNMKPVEARGCYHERNAAVFHFNVVSQITAQTESQFSHFMVRVPRGKHPLTSPGLYLTYECDKHSSMLPHHLYCFTVSGVLMCDFDFECFSVMRKQLVSSRQWMPGTYTIVVDNGLMPVSGAAFEIKADGSIETSDGLFDSSAAYRLTRIKESDPNGADRMTRLIESSWDLAYSNHAFDWYDHQHADNMCQLYGCPTIYNDAEFQMRDENTARYYPSQAMDTIIRILGEKRAKLSDEARLQTALWLLGHLKQDSFWSYKFLVTVCDHIFKSFNARRMEHLNEYHENLVEFLSTILPCDIDYDMFAKRFPPIEENAELDYDEDEDEDDYEVDDDDEMEEDGTIPCSNDDLLEQDFGDVIDSVADGKLPSPCDALDQRFKAATAELNKMIGLTDLKGEFANILSTVRFNLVRKSLGLKDSSTGSHHMLFYGNPGTGKTTVAKHLGRIFHALGLLSDGGVMVMERKNMVGRYLGETENNMESILKKAKGKVLFIDEAYTLCVKQDGDKNDYGQRVLESLLTKMAEPNPDMVVVMAGYEKELDAMLTSNTGLSGRFAHRLHFPDYSASELLQIGELILSNEEYELSDDARQHLLGIIENTVAHKGRDFSNARWIEQFIHHAIIPTMSRRVMALEKVNVKTCKTITSEDIEKGWEQFQVSYNKKMEKPRMGF